MIRRRKWIESELDVLRERYANTTNPELSRLLGRHERSIAQKARALGLRKSIEHIALIARDRTMDITHGGAKYRFTPGFVPWNKGDKGGKTGQHPNSMATRFRPGRLPNNVRPIGALRINRDGILERKVDAVKRWAAVHRLVWEAAHGPVPRGHLVVFKAGRRTTDPAAITLDAIELVSRAQLVERNSVHRHGPEVYRLAQLRGVLTRQINKRARRDSDEHKER